MVGSIINNIITDKQDIKNQLGNFNSTLPILRNFNNNIKLFRKVTTQKFIGVGTSFVLNSSTNGILGTSKLGDRRQDVAYFVFPFNDIFYEDFIDSQFIDISSTGTLDTINQKYILNSGNVLLSMIVFKKNEPINKLKLSDFNYTGSIPLVEVSVDNGINWLSITKGQVLDTSQNGNISNILLYKITANSGACEILDPFKIQINK